jgi:flagellar motor switch protein FliM
MPTVRPFRFAGLKRYTSEQVAVQESLATHLSRRPFHPQFGDSLASVIERYVKSPCKLGKIDWKPVARSDLGALLPAVGCIVVVGAAPTESKILVDIDTGLVALAIDRLLGGSGGNGRIQRPLTEIEEGVLSFIILKVLSHFTTELETGRELSLTLDRFAARLGDIQEIVDLEATYHLVGVRISIGKHVGYARILVPNSLVTQSFSTMPEQGPLSGTELDYMRRMLSAIGDVTVDGRVEAATLDLGPDDIANLETGDIVILENHEIAKSPSGVEGNVFVKLGLGQNGGLRGRVFTEGENVRLEIHEIVVQEQPPEAPMVEEGEGPPPEASAIENADNLNETQGLLRDVDAPVVVELGRIRMNTAQVARLRTGQILRLPRGPNDPVDLVVNGKLFARGELIEVDGELGVRLLQVAGA